MGDETTDFKNHSVTGNKRVRNCIAGLLSLTAVIEMRRSPYREPSISFHGPERNNAGRRAVFRRTDQ